MATETEKALENLIGYGRDILGDASSAASGLEGDPNHAQIEGVKAAINVELHSAKAIKNMMEDIAEMIKNGGAQKTMQTLARDLNVGSQPVRSAGIHFDQNDLDNNPASVVNTIVNDLMERAKNPDISVRERADLIGTMVYSAKEIFQTQEAGTLSEEQNSMLQSLRENLYGAIFEAREMNDAELTRAADMDIEDALARNGVNASRMPEYLRNSLEEMSEVEASVHQATIDYQDLCDEITECGSRVNALAIATNYGVEEMKTAGVEDDTIDDYINFNRTAADPARSIQDELDAARAAMEQARAEWHTARQNYFHAVVDAAKDEVSKAKTSVVYFFQDAAKKAATAFSNAVMNVRDLMDKVNDAIAGVYKKFHDKSEEFLDTVTGGMHSCQMLKAIELAEKNDLSRASEDAKRFLRLYEPLMYLNHAESLEDMKEFYQNLHDENWFGKTSPYEDVMNGLNQAKDFVAQKAGEALEKGKEAASAAKDFAAEKIEPCKEALGNVVDAFMKVGQSAEMIVQVASGMAMDVVKLPITIGEYTQKVGEGLARGAKDLPNEIKNFKNDLDVVRKTVGVELQTAAVDIKLTSIQMQKKSLERQIKKADREVAKAGMLIEGLKQEREDLHNIMAEFGDRGRDLEKQRHKTFELEAEKSEAIAALSNKDHLNVFEKANLAYLNLYKKVGETMVAAENVATAAKNFGSEAYTAAKMGESQKRLGEIANELVAAQDNLAAKQTVRNNLNNKHVIIMGKEAQAATLSPMQNMALEDAVKSGVPQRRALESVYNMSHKELKKTPEFYKMADAGKAALESICKDLGLNEKALGTLTKEAGFTEDEPVKGFDVHTPAFTAAYMSAQKLSTEDKAKVLLNALDAARQTDSTIAKMMPMEMLGYEKAVESMKYVHTMAERLGIDMDDKTLKAAYGRSQEVFAEKHAGVDTKDILVSHLAGNGEDFRGLDDIAQNLANHVHPSFETVKNFVESKAMGM